MICLCLISFLVTLFVFDFLDKQINEKKSKYLIAFPPGWINDCHVEIAWEIKVFEGIFWLALCIIASAKNQELQILQMRQ